MVVKEQRQERAIIAYLRNLYRNAYGEDANASDDDVIAEYEMNDCDALRTIEQLHG